MATSTPWKVSDSVPGWNGLYPFITSGIAATSATCCVQPIDMVKVRFQLQNEGGVKGGSTNPITTFMSIIRKEGPLVLYTGLSAGIVRQLTYGMSRLGIFQTVSDKLKDKDGNLPFSKRLFASICAGGTGALIGTPADAALVRMQADTLLPPEQRRNYKHAFDALARMAKEEGVSGFFAGATPTILRGLAINIGMLTTNSYFKEILKPVMDVDDSAQSLRFAAGALSGWTASTVSLPFDFIKTRLQKQKPDAKGVLPYKGVLDFVGKTIKAEGIMGFYAGYVTYCIRITPHITLTWVFIDNIRDIGWLK